MWDALEEDVNPLCSGNERPAFGGGYSFQLRVAGRDLPSALVPGAMGRSRVEKRYPQARASGAEGHNGASACVTGIDKLQQLSFIKTVTYNLGQRNPGHG